MRNNRTVDDTLVDDHEKLNRVECFFSDSVEIEKALLQIMREQNLKKKKKRKLYNKSQHSFKYSVTVCKKKKTKKNTYY